MTKEEQAKADMLIISRNVIRRKCYLIRIKELCSAWSLRYYDVMSAAPLEIQWSHVWDDHIALYPLKQIFIYRLERQERNNPEGNVNRTMYSREFIVKLPRIYKFWKCGDEWSVFALKVTSVVEQEAQYFLNTVLTALWELKSSIILFIFIFLSLHEFHFYGSLCWFNLFRF